MSRIVGFLTVSAVILALTAVFFHTTPASAEGVGPRYPTPEIRYDPNADDDEDATEAPTTFAPIDWRPRSLSFGGFTLGQPIQLADPQEETAKPFELRGVYAEYSAGLNLKLRSEYRFPSYDETEEAEPKPSLWVNEDVEEELSFEERLRRNLAKLTPDEQARAFGFDSAEAAQEFAKALNEWAGERIARQDARDWLGNDGYNKIRAEFGHGGGGAVAGDTSVRDASEWQNTHLYCGGECVAAGY